MSKGIVRAVAAPISLVIGKKATHYLLEAVGIVASFIPGVGPIISAAAFLEANTLFKLKPKSPATSLTMLDRLNASLVPTASRKMVLGTTAMGTDIRYVEPSGTNQEYIDYIIAVAAHKVTAIRQIWLEDTLAWDVSSGVESSYSGFLTVDVRLEGTAANAITINSGASWSSSSARLTGCAYLHLRVNRGGTNSPFTSGLNSRMTVIGDGQPLYDPRFDSTVVGGSGSQRWNDQSTWTFTNGQNIALQALAYELGWRINGELSVGRGIPGDRLDLANWITAANLCDETVTTSTGSQPRYHGAGVIGEDEDVSQVRQTFAYSCNARYRETLGKLGLVVMHNDLSLASTDPGLGDDEMIGGFTWNSDPSLEQTYNVVRGKYTDPSNASLYQMVDYPEVRLTGTPPGGIDRVLPLDLPWVDDVAMAQRIAKQQLERKQYQRQLNAVWNMAGWCYKVGDVVPVTLSALGFSRRLFRVEQQIQGFDGTCPMVLTEENDALYAWDADDRAPVTPASPIRYDPLNNPILVALRGVTAIEGSTDGVNWHAPPSPGDIYLRFSTDGGVTWGSPVELGSDGAVVGYLTNESANVAATSAGVVSSFTGTGGNFVVLEGTTDVTSSCTFSVVSSTGVTISIASDGTYTISAMSADTGTATLRANFAGTTVDKVYSIAKSKAGADGSPSKLLTVISDRQTIVYDGAGSLNPSTQTVNFSVNKQGTSATVTWSITDLEGNAFTASTYLTSTSGDTTTLPATSFNSLINVHGSKGAIVTGTLTDGVTISDKISIVQVQAGASAPLLFLTTTAQTVTFDGTGAASPSSQSITLSANLQNVSGTATWAATAYNSAGTPLGSVTLGGSGNVRTLSNTQFVAPGATAYVVVTATLGSLSDTTTIVKLTQGSDAIVVDLTNQAATVAADASGTVASFAGAGGNYKVYRGTNDITTGNGVTYSVLSSSGATASINSSTGAYTISAMSADQGTVTFRATLGTATYDLVYNIAKSKAGAGGAAGAGSFTLVNQNGMTISGNSATKTGGTNGAYDSSVTSAESFIGGATCSFSPGASGKEFLMGLNTDPTTDNSWASIDYCFTLRSSGSVEIFESGTSLGTFGTWTVGDVFQVTYNNATVVYTHNGTVAHTTTGVASGKKLYLDSTFLTTGAVANNITFAAAGAVGATGSGVSLGTTSPIAQTSTGTGSSTTTIVGNQFTSTSTVTLWWDGQIYYSSGGAGTTNLTFFLEYTTDPQRAVGWTTAGTLGPIAFNSAITPYDNSFTGTFTPALHTAYYFRLRSTATGAAITVNIVGGISATQ